MIICEESKQQTTSYKKRATRAATLTHFLTLFRFCIVCIYAQQQSFGKCIKMGKSRNVLSGDEQSAMSAATPIISNNSRRKKKKISRRVNNDSEEWSTVTPVISNTTLKAKSHHKKETPGIDYGQIVIDSRNSSTNKREMNEEQEKIRHDLKNDGKFRDEDDVQVSNLSETPQTANEMHRYIDDPSKKLVDKVCLSFLVALLSTIRFFLSTTSSLTCRFMEVDIGFSPENVKFNSTKIQVGPFAYGSGQCLSYPNDFTKVFIDGRSSWRASRIASIVNIVLGFLVFMTTAFVMLYRVLKLRQSTSIFSKCIKGCDASWTLIVFVFVILSFIFEVIKFALIGTNLCTEEMWMTNQYRYVPAQECKFSTGAKCSFGAIVIDVMVVIVLSVRSNYLRIVLGSMCCCGISRKRRALVNADNDGEMSRPRYFFEGVESGSDNASVIPNQVRHESISRDDKSDDESIVPHSVKKQARRLSDRNPTEGKKLKDNKGELDSLKSSVAIISGRNQRRWPKKMNNQDSDDESLVPLNISNISSKEMV